MYLKYPFLCAKLSKILRGLVIFRLRLSPKYSICPKQDFFKTFFIQLLSFFIVENLKKIGLQYLTKCLLV